MTKRKLIPSTFRKNGHKSDRAKSSLARQALLNSRIKHRFLYSFHTAEFRHLNKKKVIREVLDSLDVAYKTIRLDEFMDLKFSGIRFTGNGSLLLEKFGTGKPTLENLTQLLRFAKIKRKTFNINKRGHLCMVLGSLPNMDYGKIKPEEFGNLKFNTYLFVATGRSLLKRFAKRKKELGGGDNLRTFYALLKRVNIKRKQLDLIRKTFLFDINNEDQLKIVLKSLTKINYNSIKAGEFRDLVFNTPTFKGKGLTLLIRFAKGKKNLGNGDNSQTLDLLLEKAGYDRKRLNLMNPDPKELRKVLESMDNINYERIGTTEFRNLKFDSPLFDGFGVTLLKNFAKGKNGLGDGENTETLDVLLKRAGYTRKRLDLADPDSDELRTLFKSIPRINPTILVSIFRNLQFDLDLFWGKGITLLRRFRDESKDTLDVLLVRARYIRAKNK